MSFTADLSIENNIAIIILTGELDASVAYEFKAKIEEVTAQSVTKLVLDMTNLEYLSDAGLRMIIYAKQKIGSDIQLDIVNPSEMVLDVISIVGFQASWNIITKDSSSKIDRKAIYDPDEFDYSPAVETEWKSDQLRSKSNILTRYLNIDLPLQTEIEKQFSIFVQVLLEAEDVDNPMMEIQDFDKSKLPEIEIVVRANNFEIIGSNTQILSVERDDDSEVRFSLIPKEAGEQKIRVDCYQNGRRIGTYKKNITVVSERNNEPIKNNIPQILPVKIKSNPAPPPDLELCVELDSLNNSNHQLRFTIHSTKQDIKYHHFKSGEVTLPESPQQKLERIYQQLGNFASTLSRKFVFDEENNQENINNFDNLSKNQERRMQILGNQLWEELIPDQLKDHYWRFKSKISTLLITSDEPWIPWEMVKPYRIVNREEKQDPFWCEQFAISRWLSSESGTIDELKFNTVIPIAPLDSNLPSVKEEIDFVEQLMQLYPHIKKISSPLHQLMDILDSFTKSELSILHFACHGMFDSTLPDDSAIKLSNMETLSPSDLPHIFNSTNPLIFINACHGGRAGFQFTKIGGWAEKCVNAEASAFIGAMWEVNDKLALQFAQKFYQLLLTESPTKEYLTIAEAFRQAREYIKEEAPYNSTWLSYTLYADPEARILQENENRQ